MKVASGEPEDTAVPPEGASANLEVSNNDEFCIKNEELCI